MKLDHTNVTIGDGKDWHCLNGDLVDGDDGLLLEEGGATPGGGASSAYVGADQLARTSTSAAFEREQGGAKTTKKKQKKKKNQEDTDLDVEKISLEMLGLFKIVRLPDEVVYVHSGADTYLYMRYQKMMIYLLWAMFLFSLLVLLPLQYSNRLDSSSHSPSCSACASDRPSRARRCRRRPPAPPGVPVPPPGVGAPSSSSCRSLSPRVRRDCQVHVRRAEVL